MKLLGILSFVPLVIILALLVSRDLPMHPLLVIATFVSIVISIFFVFIGYKNGYRWMPLWIVMFVVLIPISNIVFWFVHRKVNSLGSE